ncbi:MAG: inorganic phosphate transporter [Chloroflexota bacterium]
MVTESILMGILIATALVFDFLNGFHDASNIVATMISSQAITPRMALALSATADFVGPFLFGVAVAKTIGHDVVAAVAITLPVLLAALFSAIVWNLVTWWMGIPSSSSHALIGGLIGAVGIGFGLQNILVGGLAKILMALLISPVLGLVTGHLIMKLTLFAARGASPRVSHLFRKLQWLTSLSLALSHGTNDAQKTMGIITMGLVATNYLSRFVVPWWVIVLSAAAIALGTASGGWRLIRTLGGRFYKIRPIHGFTSQLSSAIIIIGAALLGGPVSTTQVVSSAIMGVGSAERLSKVRWGVAGSIAITWLVTIPASAVMAALFYHPIAWATRL